MDLSKLPIKPAKRSVATSPKEIFKALTLRGSIQNIWEPQAEALAEWEKNRTAPDTVIQMNTGGGKTLAGLLIAQSLVNETKAKVLYVCPTNQLVEQVAGKAAECGIAVATYVRGKWQNAGAYDAALGPCITNYAAVFNGKTIFRDHEVRGIVFDDAHVAGNFVRGHFAISLSKDDDAFDEVAALYKPYFTRSGQIQQFEDAVSGDWLALLFVPTFETAAQAPALRKILVKHGIADGNQGFAWAHLKDHLPVCAIIVSGSGFEITPALLPVRTLPYFGASVRRVYLTATMPSQVEFLRTFGVLDPIRIVPGGKSGEAQRQFLFLKGDTDEECRLTALQLVENRKACIIAPSEHAADEWCPPATRFGSTQGHAAIQAFANAKGTEKLALAARYDGIDLPGDACRVLILAGMPLGDSLMDRFLDQTLRIERLRTAHRATRIVQAIGRIFRSNTDHGAVLVTSGDLARWLADPQNRQYMPALLQRQITLGLELTRMVEEGHTNFADLLDAVLTGRKDWVGLFEKHVGSFEAFDQNPEPQWFVDAVTGERAAFEMLWARNYAGAAAEYAKIAAACEPNDRRLSAWYRHWEGLAHFLSGDRAAAARGYLSAANERSELGRPRIERGMAVSGESLKPSRQAIQIGKVWNQRGVKIAADIKEITQHLVYGSDTAKAEEALKKLGDLLGITASRPDKDVGTGPDVVWRAPEHKVGAAIEAKTNKGENGQYKKKEDIGQFHDHVQWLNKSYPDEVFRKAIVGRKLSVSEDANPPQDLCVITLDQFQALSARLSELYQFITEAAKGGNLDASIERGLQSLGLSFPACFDALESSLAVDLKLVAPPSATSTD